MKRNDVRVAPVMGDKAMFEAPQDSRSSPDSPSRYSMTSCVSEASLFDARSACGGFVSAEDIKPSSQYLPKESEKNTSGREDTLSWNEILDCLWHECPTCREEFENDLQECSDRIEVLEKRDQTLQDSLQRLREARLEGEARLLKKKNRGSFFTPEEKKAMGKAAVEEMNRNIERRVAELREEAKLKSSVAENAVQSRLDPELFRETLEEMLAYVEESKREQVEFRAGTQKIIEETEELKRLNAKCDADIERMKKWHEESLIEHEESLQRQKEADQRLEEADQRIQESIQWRKESAQRIKEMDAKTQELREGNKRLEAFIARLRARPNKPGSKRIRKNKRVDVDFRAGTQQASPKSEKSDDPIARETPVKDTPSTPRSRSESSGSDRFAKELLARTAELRLQSQARDDFSSIEPHPLDDIV